MSSSPTTLSSILDFWGRTLLVVGQGYAKTAESIDAQIAKQKQTISGLTVQVTSSAMLDFPDVDAEINLYEANQKLSLLLNQKKEIGQTRHALGDYLARHILDSEGGINTSDVETHGQAGDALAALGLRSKAAVHYQSAQFFAWAFGNTLQEKQYRLAELQMLPEEDGLWEKKVDELRKYRSEFYLPVHEVGERTGVDRRGASDYQGWRTLTAEAVQTEAEVRVRNGLESSDDDFVQLKQSVIDSMTHVAASPRSISEARALAGTLAVLHQVDILDAALASRQGDLTVVRDRSTQLRGEVAHAVKMYAAFDTADERLAQVLESSDYLLFKQSGLPIDGLYTWWNQAYSKYRGVPAFEAQAAILRQKVPHLFDSLGELKPRTEITDAPDADQAAALEGTLHMTTGSAAENILIDTPTSMLGASAGAKLFAGLGAFCGPAAEICVPVGGALGGIAGFAAGDQMVKALHRTETDEMVRQARLAGTGLLRTNQDEALQIELTTYLSYLAAAVPIAAIGGLGAQAERWSMASAARNFLSRQGVLQAGRYLAGGFARETSYAGAWGKAAWSGLKGFFRGQAPDPIPFIKPDLDRSFEMIFARLSPRELSRHTRNEWREIFDDLVARGDSKLFKAPKAPKGPIPGVFDGFWRPIADAVDHGLHLDNFKAFFHGRLRAAAAQVSAEVPEIAENEIALLGRKELLRHAFRMETAPLAIGAAAGGAAAQNSGAFSRAWRFWCDSVWSDQMARSYRLGWAPWAFDKYFLKKNEDGSFELSWGDGRLDTWWGLGGKWLGWASLSTWAGFNTLTGGLVGNALKGTTFVGFQGMAALAASDANLSQLEGAADEQVLFLGAMMLVASGKSSNGGPLLQAISRTPFLQRIPSLSSFVTRYDPKSTLAAPNYFWALPGSRLPVNVAGLSLLSLPYNIALISSMRSLTSKALLDADPYANWQIGVKFFFVGTILNPTQWALGTNTARAQGGTRLLGIFFDLIPAMVFPPYYTNKEIMHASLDRMAGEGPTGQAKVMRHFFSQPDNWMDSAGASDWSTVNRSFDLVGVLKRDSYFRWTDPQTWHAGWRWESEGLSAWLDAMETGYIDKKTRQAVAGVEQRHPDVYMGAVTELYDMFQHPDQWMGSEFKTRGMVIAACMAKWHAERYAQGEGEQFKPFSELVEGATPEWRDRFWQKVPEARSKEEFLRRAEEIQEMPLDDVLELLEGSYQDVRENQQ